MFNCKAKEHELKRKKSKVGANNKNRQKIKTIHELNILVYSS